MTKWLMIDHQRYNENTSQYGYGDFPESIAYIAAVIEADTLRKAQNAAKKIYPRVRFGGMFSPHLLPASAENIKHYGQPADTRLTRGAVHAHRASLIDLGLWSKDHP